MSCYDFCMIEIYLIVFTLFMFGAIIGSFLHVVAERYMASESPWKGRSMCPQCKKHLHARELMPIFSYLVQQGRCRGCRANIPIHYMVLEALSGFFCVVLLFPAIISNQAYTVHGLYYIVACLLLILIHIDMRSMMLPDTFIILLGIVTLAISVLLGTSVDSMLFGMLAGAGLLYAIWAVTGGQGLGFGDVKLMIPLGILFGLQGVITMLFMAFLSGGFVGIILLATTRATRKTAIPFGPFLAGSALILLIVPAIPDRFFDLLGV